MDTRQKSDRTPLVMTYNRFLPNITKTIRKNQNILQINKNCKAIFKSEPIAAFKRNKNIQDTTTKFKSQLINKTWKTFHNSTCTTEEYAIYFMKGTICNLQHVGQNETPFNIRLSNHRKDVKDPKVILADKHFQKSGHRFNEHTRFMAIDRLTHKNLDKEMRTSYLKQKLFDKKIRNK